MNYALKGQGRTLYGF
uniref:HISTOGRANIN=N-methyl-D-aspartate antagonist/IMMUNOSTIMULATORY peptide n=1 Tax=Bos taurus TaxID=9913 RepID=Q9TQQ5_BOVIN|nr:histogranin=N-methyl-D-aspartate receptor antagonist [cattle, adrenal medulla, Peptide, 15 aa] [Bos taurus]AAB36377.1 histogranin=N-methyl-D-aspartate antagonist/immunostimulatory peptide [cattle, adrenal medulla, Peptide, 15 aa] [Bos taurus]